MRIHLVCPAPPGSRKGNRVTAARWADLLGRLGHLVTISSDWARQACDVLVALHAKKSHAAIRQYRRQRPEAPLVVVLTGTDLYRDLARSGRARQSLEWADRLVVLHDLAALDLPERLRPRVRVVIQSAGPVLPRPPRPRDVFQFCVLGHLREVKDPMRPALALRRLRGDERLRVVQAGAALSPHFAARAERAMTIDPRYRWLGSVPRGRALRLLASSHAMILSSRLEGGANVISEAVVNGVPVLASRAPGNVGLLGEAYPAYYPVGDTAALAALMARLSSDGRFEAELRQWVRRLAPRFRPPQERAAWRDLLSDLVPTRLGAR